MEIQNQITVLKQQAEELKARDFNSTVKEIQSSMKLFGITIRDLQAPARKSTKGKQTIAVQKKGKSSSKAAGKSVEPKYVGPEGETWSGRGLSPKWLATLVANGAKREDFLIQKTASNSI